MSKFVEKAKEMYKYINVTIDKEFALELIPIVELVMTDNSTMKRIAREELTFFEKLYVKYCESKEKQTCLYNKIIENSINTVRYKVLMLLETLYDILHEDSPQWNTRWKIKPYYKIKYNEVKIKVFGVDSIVLEPKPEYVDKDKQNEEFRKYNLKRRAKCQKWRDSNIKFYKKVLKIINN